MTAYLLFDDALHSPEVRHEIGEPVMDPVAFIDNEGRRIVVGSLLEESTFAAREDVCDEYVTYQALGSDELIKDKSFPYSLIDSELVLRALQKFGIDKAVVPPNFRLQIGDYLRDKGVTLEVEPDVWVQRRRRKTPWEIEGIERAQRAAETAMLTAARMLREAEPSASGTLRFEGEELTAEWIRESMIAELLSQGAESEEILVQSGDACLEGHGLGTGPILPDQSCIIDCFPRDRRTGTYSDMTRTFVPGTPSDELVRLHADCRAALAIAFDAVRPGAVDAHARVAELLHARGYPVVDRHEGDEPLREGFFHSLGHGVGLEVHEKPWVGRRADELQEGDVVALEPGLYFRGIGGVRLEDTVLVTAGGPEFLTDPYPYDLTP
jgi:Xaa-Pro aminopeptidase